MRAFFSSILRLFLTGIATVLPLLVTVFVVGWLVRVTDAYIGPSSNFGKFLSVVFGPNPYAGYVLGYLVVILLMILLGSLVTRATVGRIRKAFDSMFSRIPLLGKIYKAVGQAVDLFGNKDRSGLERFGGIAHVRFGNIRMLAFVISEERYVLRDDREYVLIFVPYSPIPATGFNMLAPVEDVQRLDMPVEDLAKLLMSLGLLAPQVLRGTLGKRQEEKGENEKGTSRPVEDPVTL